MIYISTLDKLQIIIEALQAYMVSIHKYGRNIGAIIVLRVCLVQTQKLDRNI